MEKILYKNIIAKKIEAAMLLCVLGFNTFGGSIPYVQATAYDKGYNTDEAEAAEAQAEEEIRNAEMAAGIDATDEDIEAQVDIRSMDVNATGEDDSERYISEEFEEQSVDGIASESNGQIKRNNAESTTAVTDDRGDIPTGYTAVVNETGVIDMDYSITGDSYLESDMVIHGNLEIYKSLYLNGHTLIVEGKIKQYGDIQVDGVLNIDGDYEYIGGNISFYGGNLIVGNDFTASEYTKKMIQMKHSTDYMCINGDIMLGRNAYADITDGVIEVKGDFVEQINVDFLTNKIKLSDEYSNFQMLEESLLYLSGEGQQVVYLPMEKAIIANIEALSYEEKDDHIISFSKLSNYENYIDNGCMTNYGYMIFEEQTLAGSSNFYGNCYLEEGELHLNRYEVHIYGDFVQNGNVYLESGSLYIADDYRIQSMKYGNDGKVYGTTQGVVDSSQGGEVYVLGDFFTASVEDHTEYMTSGKWYFSGDIIQIGKDAKNFCVGSGWSGVFYNNSQRIINIKMDNPTGNSLGRFNNDGSVYKIIAENSIYAESLGSIYIEVEGAVIIDNNNYSLLGKYYADYILSDDFTITDNIRIDKRLYINGDITLNSTLDVGRSISVISGSILMGKDSKISTDTMDIDAGELTLTENAEISARTVALNNDSLLAMTGEESVIKCTDMSISSSESSGELNAGKIYISGDLVQKTNGAADNFVTTDACEIHMSGSACVQRVSFDSMECVIESMYLETRNGYVEFITDVNIKNLYNDPDVIKKDYMLAGITLTADMSLEGDWELVGNDLDLAGYTMTIEGDLLVTGGNIHLNGGSLNVTGDVILAAGSHYIQDGSLEVGGNLRMQNPDDSGYIESRANLIMNDEKGRIIVYGSCYIQPAYTFNVSLKKGEMVLHGNMEVLSKLDSVYTYLNRNDGIDIIIDGEEMQTIKGYDIFPGNLTINNRSGVLIESVCSLSGSYTDNSGGGEVEFNELKVNCISDINAETVNGNVSIYLKGSMEHDLMVNGELRLYANTDVNSHTLDADTIYAKGHIIMHNAADMLNVCDIEIQYITASTTDLTEGVINVSGNLTVDEDSSVFLPSDNHTIIFDNKDAVRVGQTQIHIYEEASIMNIAILRNRLYTYDFNREYKEDMAKKLIVEYEDEEKPDMPKNFRSIADEPYYVVLTWADAEDNVEIEKYKIYRDGRYLGRTKSTWYIDWNLNSDTNYRYQIIACDAKGNESEKTEILQVVTAADRTAPVIKNEIEAVGTSTSVKLDMGDSFEDANGYIDHYMIYRNEEKIAVIDSPAKLSYTDDADNTYSYHVHDGMAEYTDEKVVTNQEYIYSVVAVDGAGNESEPYELTAYTDELPDAPEFILSSEFNSAFISILKSGERNCSKYAVYRRSTLTAKGSFVCYIDNDKRGEEIVRDKGLVSYRTYYYYVVPVNRYGYQGLESETKPIKITSEIVPPAIQEIAYSDESDGIYETLDISVSAVDNYKMKNIYAYIVEEGSNSKAYITKTDEAIDGRRAKADFRLYTDGLSGVYELHIAAEDAWESVTEEVKVLHINENKLQTMTAAVSDIKSTSFVVNWDSVDDAIIYKVEILDGDYYEAYNTTNANSMYVQVDMPEVLYKLRVKAYGEKGILAMTEEPLEVTTVFDDEKPVFTYVEDEKIVLSNKGGSLRIFYSDNVMVSDIQLWYRRQGDSDWSDIGKSIVNKKTGVDSFAWDTSGLESGTYEVKYQLTDSSGNISDEVIRAYRADMDAPKIRNMQLHPKDWKINITWDEFPEEDYSSCTLYRIDESGNKTSVYTDQTGDAGSFEEMISPEQTYTYSLYAYDTYGNEAICEVSGRSIDNDIFPPELPVMYDIYAARNMDIALSADAASDNDEIALCEWNMGNGDVITGSNILYSYGVSGTFLCSCTVTDKSGNSTVHEFSTIVGEHTGTVALHVVDQDGNSVEGMTIKVCINDRPCDVGKKKTNYKGDTTFGIPEGVYNIALIKEDYVPAVAEVAVAEGERTELEITVKKGPLYGATTTTKKATLNQIEKAGIDLEAYDNRNGSSISMAFKYELDNIKNGYNFCYTNNRKWSTMTVGTPSYEVGKGDKRKISICNLGTEDKPVIAHVETRTVDVDWLNNVYMITLTLLGDEAGDLHIENAAAIIQLDEHLSLAKMKDDKDNEEEKRIGKFGKSNTKQVTWYVVPKDTGDYNFSIKILGMLQPFDERIESTLNSNDFFEKKEASGMHLYVYPEKNAYIGENYYIQYKLVNESDSDYHYVTVNFGQYETTGVSAEVNVIQEGAVINTVRMDTGICYYEKDADSEEVKYTIGDNNRLVVREFGAGKVLYGTSKAQFNAGGDKYTQFYNLAEAYAKKIEGDSGIKVTIEAVEGHLAKRVIRKMKVPEAPDNRKEPKGVEIPDYITTEQSDKNTKDPINIMTGAFNIQHGIASVPGGDEPLSFNIFYDSTLTDECGELGRGWYHNYEMSIERHGSILLLKTNPHQIMYFGESDETENTICGTYDGEKLEVSDEDTVDRLFYQMGTDGDKNRIAKNKDGYILYTDDKEYRFDTEGRLTGYKTKSGGEVTITRTEVSMEISDAATGRSVTAELDENGRIISVTDAAGNRSEFCYTDDHMWKLVSKGGAILIYKYDEYGHIIQGLEGDNRVYVENTYDDKGRVLTQIPNGNESELTRFSYKEDSETGVTSVVMYNADGTVEKAASDIYGQGLYYENALGGRKEFSYNDNKDMTAFRNPDGSGADYLYDSSGNLSGITETSGRKTSYVYNDDHRITNIRSNDGTDITYTYNDKGQRVKVESGNGITAEYTYNEYGQVLTEKSQLGTLTYTYKDGMLDKLTDYNGKVHTFSYDANGNVTSYTDGAGVTTDYEVDVRGNVTKETVHLGDDKAASTSYTYDSYGNMLSKTDALGNQTVYHYDHDDHLTEEIRPDGTSYEYHYDVNGNLTEIVCPDGETTVSAAYDAAGNTLSITNLLGGMQNASYSAGSQILSLTQANGGKVSYTYYDNGLLKSQTDANGNTSTLTYDAAGRLSTVTDGAGAVTKLSYDKDGNLSLIENALGKSTLLEYNNLRKVSRSTDNNGNTTLYEYNNNLNCTKVTDAEGGITELSYDARNRITSVTKKGKTKADDVTLSMTYDNLDNVISITDGEGNTHRMEYNELSQLKKVYDAKGVLTGQYDYDSLGNCISVTDVFGVVTERSYDAFGNLIKELNKDTGNATTYSYVGGRYISASTDALGNSASYTYDNMGNLETVTNPNGGVTTYKYDLNNNMTDEIIGEDYHVRYTYNAQNLAESKLNSRNQKAEYKYDLLGRITEQKDEAGTISYTYDGNDNVLTVTEKAGDKTTVITRTYDKLNRVTSYDDGRGNKIGYAYDELGNLITLTYPNGEEVNYTYDKNGNILTMTDWKNRKTSYAYDENGRLIKTTRANGTVETRGYDKAGRLAEILDKKGDTEINRQQYTYDSSGNITEVKQLYAGELDFTNTVSAKMTYDKNNRLLTYNGEDIQYDKDGNMTYGPLAGKMTTFTYDCRNRLVSAGGTRYIYDAENNRIGVETSEKKTTYVINTQPELSQVLQSTETNLKDNKETTTYYYYGNGLNAQDNGESYFVYHFNNVGSTMAVTDAKGNVVETYNYTPYGELIDGEYREDIPFLYNGQYGVTTDSNGLYYMRARYYNVEIKRFINQDVLLGVLERVSSLNRYAYVEGNPVSFLDPFGLEKIAYYTEMHEELSVISTVIVALQLVLAAVVVINPATFSIVLPIEEWLGNVSTVVALLDSYALIMLGYNSDTSAEKIKNYALAVWSGISAFTGNILKCFKIFNDKEFRIFCNSILSGIEKMIGDGGVDGY